MRVLLEKSRGDYSPSPCPLGSWRSAPIRSARIPLAGFPTARAPRDSNLTLTREVVGGFAILEAESMHEAIELTKRLRRVHGDEWDLECEEGQLDGPEFGKDV
jgi:hypothetical protein